MLRWSIASVCMGGALEGKLSAAAKAGFRAVELFENDLTFFNGKPKDVRRMAADLGLEIVALRPLRDFEAMPAPIRGRNFERAARKLELMQREREMSLDDSFWRRTWEPAPLRLLQRLP